MDPRTFRPSHPRTVFHMFPPLFQSENQTGSRALWVVATATTAGSQSAPLPPLPVTQLDARQSDPELDGQRISLGFANPTPIRDVLLLLVRDTRLSVIPHPSLDQTFVGDLKNVSVREALDLILEPLS